MESTIGDRGGVSPGPVRLPPATTGYLLPKLPLPRPTLTSLFFSRLFPFALRGPFILARHAAFVQGNKIFRIWRISLFSRAVTFSYPRPANWAFNMWEGGPPALYCNVGGTHKAEGSSIYTSIWQSQGCPALLACIDELFPSGAFCSFST